MGKLTPVLTLAMLAFPAFADGPPPGSVAIDSFTYRGGGCPIGSVAANISPDNEAITLLFDSFIADSEASRTGLDQKNCSIDLNLITPPGWKFALFCVDYRGFADLERGAKGTLSTAYRFGANQSKALPSHSILGPYLDDYQKLQALPLNAVPWSTCGNNNGLNRLTISSTATVDARGAPESQEVALSSSRHRYSEKDLGAPIQSMVVKRKYSSAPCRQGREFGFNGTKAWVNRGCRALFTITFRGGSNPGQSSGLLTVDSVDGYVSQHYGIAWQRCEEGRWVQTNGNQTCRQACRSAGLRPSTDSYGAACASGETRPSSAVGSINYPRCWPNCAPQGNIQSFEEGIFCYRPGQTRDFDRTDRTVGCFCK